MSKSQTGSQEVVGAAALADALENLEKAPAPPSPKKPAAADPAAPNTEEAASLLSRLTFSWVSGMLRLGCTRTLRICTNN